MKFGRIALEAGEGAILAHSVRGPGVALKKGEIIRPAHIAALAEAGVGGIVAARLEPGDVTENVAAQRLAEQGLVAALRAVEVDRRNFEPGGDVGIEHDGGLRDVRIARRPACRRTAASILSAVAKRLARPRRLNATAFILFRLRPANASRNPWDGESTG